jgi:hypothetical protein
MIKLAAKRIAVVQGAPSAAIQEMFCGLIQEWQPAVGIAGVIAESLERRDRKCTAGYLRNIVSGTRYPIFQDDSSGADSCDIYAEGATEASDAIKKDIAAGCDLVVLSKFGKLEAAGQGLADAFLSAIAAEKPILTSVPPVFEAAWMAFASPLYIKLSIDRKQVEKWWQSLGARKTDA